MVKYSPFQADLFTLQSIEKQVENIKREQVQKENEAINIQHDASIEDTVIFQKITELEARVEVLETNKEKKRKWFS